MSSSALWPLATAIVATVFTLLLFWQYVQRRKAHQLWWAVGFAMYAAAAYMEYAAIASGGWDPILFRLYVVTTAILVPVLAQGTVALNWKHKLWGNAYLVYNVFVSGLLVLGVFSTPLLPQELARADVATYAALGGTAMSYPRVLSLFLTIPATFVLLGGAVRSIFLFSRKREYAYRMWANVLIATATIVIASAGSMAKAGNISQFYLAELVAALLYLGGFLLAGTLERGAKASRRNGEAEDERPPGSTSTAATAEPPSMHGEKEQP
jgi:hypothetical protein